MDARSGVFPSSEREKTMPIKTPNRRRGLAAAVIAATLLSGGLALPASAAQDRLPDVRLTYADLGLDSAAGRHALVERVQAVAADHCSRFGALIVPYGRRQQPRYCLIAVRGEILRAMPREVRAAYDLGRRPSGG
jgi:UrcA family protein